ncbi:MAG: HEPN domain-containing protein [Bacteroidales bacterium]
MVEEFNIEKTYNHWIDTSEKDFGTMINLYNSGDYLWSLFIGHLVIEKLLKAYYIIINRDHPPFTHDLSRLAELSRLKLTTEQSDWLDTITTFNINARYDSYKDAFLQKMYEGVHE